MTLGSSRCGISPPADGRHRRLTDSSVSPPTRGITNVLCIRGDSQDAADGGPTIRDTIHQVARAIPDALVGATFNQYAPNRERALANLAGKLRAGARYIQTQAMYDISALETLAITPEIANEAPYVVPMVMPLLSLETVAAVEQRLGIAVPAAYRDRVAAGEEAGWSAFSEIVERSVESRHIAGLAIMTFEADSDPETANHLLKVLKAAGALT